jgi:hypothetical protein
MKVTQVEPTELATALKKILPAASTLPASTVIVPSSRVASALRRDLTGSGALAGVRFFTPIEVAEDILIKSGIAFQECSQTAFALGLQILIESEDLKDRLEYFNLRQLRTGSGYSQAISITLEELESAGLHARDLRGLTVKNGGIPEKRFHDLATLWDATDQKFLSDEPPAWTTARILQEATHCLDKMPDVFPYPGPRILVLCGAPTNVEAQFYASIPDLQIFYIPALPERREFTERLKYISSLLGGELKNEPMPGDGKSEIDVLHAFLFQSPKKLADPSRVRSQKVDGTVHLEVTSGIEEELAVTVRWVAEQIFEHRTPLEKIAVLLPSLDPMAGMLVERLDRLDWMGYTISNSSAEGQAPVYVAGGLPARLLPSGLRIGALLRTLQGRMGAEDLVNLVPGLQVSRILGEDRPVTRAEAMEIVFRCGTLGGSSAHPDGYLEWRPALLRRAQAIRKTIERDKDVDDPETLTYSRGGGHLRHQLEMIQSILPAIQAVEELCHRVHTKEPLESLWTAVRKFCDEWMVSLPDLAGLLVRMEESIQSLTRRWVASVLQGDHALEALQIQLDQVRLPVSRFGQPRIYIGTVKSAVGMTFDAVRIIGLAEGELPAAPHEDAILPDFDRAQLENALFKGQPALPRGSDRAASDLHALHRIIRGTRNQLVLSAPRETLDRQTREPSEVLLEAAAALWRHDWEAGPTPTMRVFRSAYLQPGNQSRPEMIKLASISASACQDTVALRNDSPVPSSWSAEQTEMRKLILAAEAMRPSVLDGILEEKSPLPFELGLDPKYPLSASRLQRMIECPHRFLLECVLGWEEPVEPPLGLDIDPLSYGSLLHRVTERFLGDHGVDFAARKADLGKWIKLAETIAADEFKQFMDEYPLIGNSLRTRKRRRLQYDIARVLRWDWEHWRSPSRFLHTEFAFGYPNPIAMELGATVYLRGFIDRIDEQPNGWFIRDLKSGKSHPRAGKESAPIPRIDTQLVVYARALEQVSAFSGKSVAGVAYVYARRGGDLERRFEHDLADLLSESQDWLQLSVRLLQHRTFPRTTDPEDCTFCPFKPVCGPKAASRAEAIFATVTGHLGSFRDFKEKYRK